jgi:hypothetical protein
MGMRGLAPLFAWPRVVNGGWLDAAAAALLAAGSLAGAVGAHQARPLVLVGATVLTTSVAWRRRAPVAAALVASAGYLTFELTAVSSSTVEPAALVFVFYTLGQYSARGRTAARAAVSVMVLWTAGHRADATCLRLVAANTGTSRRRPSGTDSAVRSRQG